MTTSDTSTTSSTTTTESASGDAKSATGAPEAYEPYKAPDGYNLDDALVDKINPLFKELGLTQDQAQRLVDFYSENAIAQAKSIETAIAKTRETWVTAVHADPELGPRLDGIKADIGRAFDNLSLPSDLRRDFSAAMDLTGAGDNPAFIKVFARMAKAFNEGKPVSGGGPSPMGQKPSGAASRPSAAQAIYPNLPSAGR